jgi:hypothetical protein
VFAIGQDGTAFPERVVPGFPWVLRGAAGVDAAGSRATLARRRGVAGRKTAAAKRGEAGSAEPSAGVERYRQPSPQACTTPCGRVRLGLIRISRRGFRTA